MKTNKKNAARHNIEYIKSLRNQRMQQQKEEEHRRQQQEQAKNAPQKEHAQPPTQQRDMQLTSTVQEAIKMVNAKKPVRDIVRNLRKQDVVVLMRMVQKFALLKHAPSRRELDVMRYLLLACSLFAPRGESKTAAQEAVKALHLSEDDYDRLSRTFGIVSSLQPQIDHYHDLITKGKAKAVGTFIKKDELLKIFHAIEHREVRDRGAAIDVIVAVLKHSNNNDLQDMANDMLTELGVSEEDIASMGKRFYFFGKPYNKRTFEEKVADRTRKYLGDLTKALKSINESIGSDMQDYPAEAKIVKAAFVTTIPKGVRAIVNGDVAEMPAWQNAIQQSNEANKQQPQEQSRAAGVIASLNKAGLKKEAARVARIMKGA